MIQRITLATLLSSLALLSACAETDREPTTTNEVTFSDPSNDSLVARVTLQDGTELSFLDLDGEVTVSEYAPIGAPSYLDEAVLENHATALEIFHAFAPESQAPELLLRAHAARAEAGEAERQPRDLSFLAAPRQVRAEPLSSAHYDATCTFAADGQQYFDGWWKDHGWNWHWYTYMNPENDADNQVWAPITPSRSEIRAHSCNPGAISLWFTVNDITNGGTVHQQNVNLGWRSLFYRLGGGASRRHQARVNFTQGDAYSMGVTTP